MKLIDVLTIVLTAFLSIGSALPVTTDISLMERSNHVRQTVPYVNSKSSCSIH